MLKEQVGHQGCKTEEDLPHGNYRKARFGHGSRFQPLKGFLEVTQE